MKSKYYLQIILAVLMLTSLLIIPACKATTKNGNEETEARFTVPSTFPVQDITCNPVGLQLLPGSVAYLSDKNYLTVQLPEGWAASEGPECLVTTCHIEGLVAFNSWGQRDFWVHSTRTEMSEQYGAGVVASQVPEGGAYLALVLNNMPPIYDDYPLQYPCNDLSGLLLSHNWRQSPASSATFINFFKWGRSFNLEIYCSPEASDETVAELNQVLMSWRFDENWVGDIEWAATIAKTLIPEEVSPLMFPLHSASYGEYKTEAEVRGTTVHFKFTYCAGVDSCHWWEIEVPLDGKAILVADSGVALSTFSTLEAPDYTGLQPYIRYFTIVPEGIPVSPDSADLPITPSPSPLIFRFEYNLELVFFTEHETSGSVRIWENNKYGEMVFSKGWHFPDETSRIWSNLMRPPKSTLYENRIELGKFEMGYYLLNIKLADGTSVDVRFRITW